MLKRAAEIKAGYEALIDQHLSDLVRNRTDKMYEIEDFADLLNIHPTHLSSTIKELTGTSACGLYQPKILEVAKKLLASHEVKEVALILTFEPSHFTKWFKKLAGMTPRWYRKSLNQDHFSL